MGFVDSCWVWVKKKKQEEMNGLGWVLFVSGSLLQVIREAEERRAEERNLIFFFLFNFYCIILLLLGRQNSIMITIIILETNYDFFLNDVKSAIILVSEEIFIIALWPTIILLLNIYGDNV